MKKIINHMPCDFYQVYDVIKKESVMFEDLDGAEKFINEDFADDLKSSIIGYSNGGVFVYDESEARLVLPIYGAFENIKEMCKEEAIKESRMPESLTIHSASEDVVCKLNGIGIMAALGKELPLYRNIAHCQTILDKRKIFDGDDSYSNIQELFGDDTEVGRINIPVNGEEYIVVIRTGTLSDRQLKASVYNADGKYQVKVNSSYGSLSEALRGITPLSVGSCIGTTCGNLFSQYGSVYVNETHTPKAGI